MLLRCQCCQWEEDLDPEEAFQLGWDAPPHFSHVCCPICPAVCVVLGKTHKKAHALWEVIGRPADFELATCATDDMFGDEAKLAEAQADVEAIEAILNDKDLIKKKQ